MDFEIEVEIPEEHMESLLVLAAEQEISVEEIVVRAIRKFLERGENIAE